MTPLQLACLSASNAQSFPVAAAMRNAQRAQAAVPSGASDDWIAVFAGRIGAAGAVLTDAEIQRAAKAATDAVAAFGAVTAPPPAPVPVPAPPAPAPVPPAAPSPLKYRCGQPYLFQPVSEKRLLPRIAGEAAHLHDTFGPTHKYVDFLTGWPWTRPGGDWIDRDGIRHGATPWASVMTDAQSAQQPQIKMYDMDLTAMVNYCVETDRWLAIRLDGPAARTIAATDNPQYKQPTLWLTLADKTLVALNPWCMAVLSKGSDSPITREPRAGIPLLLEFERPAVPVVSAHLEFIVLEHWSGAAPRIDAFLVDPPLNNDPVRDDGVASQCGALDAGIDAKPGVIGAHRYLDGTALTDFVLPGGISYHDEIHFDPAIWGGAPDTTKLPHFGLGKWTNTTLQDGSNNWSLVDSKYRGEDFAPLAPGLGAMRIRMPAGVTPKEKQPVVDGSIVGSSGTQATTAMLWLPEPLFGRLDRIFVRYYFRLGGPYVATKASRKQVRHIPEQAALWTTQAGKFGIGATAANGYGGVSGSSGGPYGWQNRGAWYDCDAEMGGPDEGGWAVGHHLYDFLYQNPPGYNYGGPDGAPQDERWGQRGGLGGMLYSGHWYCIETELDLNTISSTGAGFEPDGVLRTWLDGRLVYERTGMVYRSGPVYNPGKVENKRRPARDLGVAGLWLDWFHGGKTLATFDRVSFYTGLAYGTEYIGPMKGAAA